MDPNQIHAIGLSADIPHTIGLSADIPHAIGLSADTPHAIGLSADTPNVMPHAIGIPMAAPKQDLAQRVFVAQAKEAAKSKQYYDFCINMIYEDLVKNINISPCKTKHIIIYKNHEDFLEKANRNYKILHPFLFILGHLNIRKKYIRK